MAMRVLTSNQQKTAVQLSHVHLPEHAIDCEPWEWNDGAWTRLFTVQEWEVGAVLIAVSGEQTHHGDVKHWLYVGGEDQFVGPDRDSLLKALVQAGTLLDLLAH